MLTLDLDILVRVLVSVVDLVVRVVLQIGIDDIAVGVYTGCAFADDLALIAIVDDSLLAAILVARCNRDLARGHF